MKTKINFLHFLYKDFTIENFKNEILRNFQLNTTYSLLIKISTNNNLIFKMCGPQIGLIINKEHDVVFYYKLYNTIIDRVESTTDLYNYIEDIDALEISYTIIKPQPNLILKNISNISLIKNLFNVKETKKSFNQNYFPFTIDDSYFGYKVIPSERYKFIQLIKKNNFNIDKFNIDYDLDNIYLYTPPNKKNKFIIISTKKNNDNYIRYIFNNDSGILIKVISDKILNIDPFYNYTFIRTIGKISLKIKNQKILNYVVDIPLDPISKKKIMIYDRNINIGTFDLETFKDSDGLAKVYALGFYTNIDPKPNLYYLTDEPTLDSNKLILNCINDMLTYRYNNYIFYSHNLGHYDIVFIYSVLLNYNLRTDSEYYILDTIMRDNVIIKLDIKIKSNLNKHKNLLLKKKSSNLNNSSNLNKSRYIKISFVDSLNLLNLSLDKLNKVFPSEYTKLKFPYSFVYKNNLNYIGKKPDINHYEKITTFEYDLIPSNNWNLKLESLKYLTNDLLSLYNIINEFSRLIYIHFNIQITDALTITRLTLNIFKNYFYFNKSIPLINKLFLFNFIKEGYYGGITEVYIPYGKDLVYLDVNSLYPYAALNPMPGLNCNYIESFEANGLNLDELFGFFFAKVKTNNAYLGLLPLHCKNNLILPNGNFEGIWSSEELKFAKSKGYDIKVIKGYNFNTVEDIFSLYIKKLYNYKNNSTGFLKLIYKSLLNNLLGRFGLNIIKPITQTVNKSKRDFIFSTRVVHSETILNENSFLITYDPTISKIICQEHGLDYIKVLEEDSKMNIEKNLDFFKDVSITIAAMTNSYARIFMNRIKMIILNNGGKIYYSDTDSLVIDRISLDFIREFIGSDIGQFKLEFYIKEAYFISNKTYCLVLNNNETIIKIKGANNNSVTLEDFKNMFFNKQNIVATRSNTITNYEKGSVLIENKLIQINFDSYSKRYKVYNKEGLWIDTKPLDI